MKKMKKCKVKIKERKMNSAENENYEVHDNI